VLSHVTLVWIWNISDKCGIAFSIRFVKRIYIPLPDVESRRQLISSLLSTVRHGLSIDRDLESLIARTEGFSGEYGTITIPVHAATVEDVLLRLWKQYVVDQVAYLSVCQYLFMLSSLCGCVSTILSA
jgi:hypothetical protein